MQVVITMAGFGMRFRQAGYHLPKYMIEVCGKTLFDWSLSSLRAFFNEDFYFIVREDDGAEPFIRGHCMELGIMNISIITLASPTSGQAETVLKAKNYWKGDDSLLIYNIDTYVEPEVLSGIMFNGDGCIPCFHGEGDHWSFVQLDSKGFAVSVTEKVRISDNCTIGAYYFRTCHLYEQIYVEYYLSGVGDGSIQKEQYVAPMYNQLIMNGGIVLINQIDADKVHVLGTPEEVNCFAKKQRDG